jgi:hypothetical protein
MPTDILPQRAMVSAASDPAITIIRINHWLAMSSRPRVFLRAQILEGASPAAGSIPGEAIEPAHPLQAAMRPVGASPADAADVPASAGLFVQQTLGNRRCKLHSSFSTISE